VVPELIAFDLPQGPAMLAALGDAWEAGHGVTVLDPRWGAEARATALRALRPTQLLDDDGIHRLSGGIGTEIGDALIVLTSGSMSTPKAAILTIDAVRASAEMTTTGLGIDPRQHRWLCCLPAAHIGGLSVMARSLMTGTPCDVIERPDPLELERAARRGATHVSLVATALRRIDPTLFEVILLGGAAPPVALPDNVVTTYGMTETGSGVVYDGLPLPGVSLAIGTPDSEGFGEILIDSPTTLRSYRDRPAPFVAGPDGSGRWLATGDAGQLDAEGHLRVRGRLREVIVTGGEKVYPGDVERVIASLEGVEAVAVWKRPDEVWGERVVAWVIPGEHPPTLDIVQDAVRSELAPYAMPKELELTEALPRTANGKLRRTALS
jgi:O-succinylbenzoic acid--CoA ligase